MDNDNFILPCGKRSIKTVYILTTTLPTEVLRKKEFRNTKLLESTGVNFPIQGLQNQEIFG